MPMTKKQLKKFEELLLDKRRKLLHELGYLETNSMSVTIRDSAGNNQYSEHMADQGTDTMDREEAFYLANREGRFLYHIDKALDRIKEKDYGDCHECDLEPDLDQRSSARRQAQCDCVLQPELRAERQIQQSPNRPLV